MILSQYHSQRGYEMKEKAKKFLLRITKKRKQTKEAHEGEKGMGQTVVSSGRKNFLSKIAYKISERTYKRAIENSKYILGVNIEEVRRKERERLTELYKKEDEER